MIPRLRFFAVALPLVLVAFTSPALADGGYWPRHAYAALPSIPAQRALIVHKDGMETLTVESTFDTPSPDVGWILPLPAEPTKIEVADSGTLTSLAVLLGPQVIHDLWDIGDVILPIVIWLVVLVLYLALSKQGRDPVEVITAVTVTLITFFLLWGLFSPAGSAGVKAAHAVQVVSAQKVGSYDVSILRAQDAGAVDQWLSANDLAGLRPEAVAVVDDYGARGWCFAVARLSRSEGGEATPHPLSVTFPADEPVYPMKLTRLAGSTTHVELYVIADRMAAAAGFRLVFSDTFHGATYDRRYSRDDPRRVFEGSRYGPLIGAAPLVAAMWDDCVVSRLEAHLPPAAMDQDVALRSAEFKPHRDMYFSSRGRRDAAVCILLLGAIPTLIYAGVIFAGRRLPNRRQARRLVMLAIVVLAMAVIVPLMHEVVPVGPEIRLFSDEDQTYHFSWVVREMTREGHLHEGMTGEQLAAVLAEAPQRGFTSEDGECPWFVNLYTGGPVWFERSPGNFATSRINQESWLCVYDQYGLEVPVCKLPPGKVGGAKSEEKAK
jgi:hypothetical protein